MNIIRLLSIPAGADTDADGRRLSDDWPLGFLGTDDDGAQHYITTDRLRASDLDAYHDLLTPARLGALLVEAVNDIATRDRDRFVAQHRHGYWQVRQQEREAQRKAEQARASALMDAIAAAHPGLCWSDVVSYAMGLRTDEPPTVAGAPDECNTAQSCADGLKPGQVCYCGRFARNSDGTIHDAQTDPPRKVRTDDDDGPVPF